MTSNFEDDETYSAEVKGHSFGHLPDVVRGQIMASLPFRDRLKARLISKAWSEEKIFGGLEKIVFEDYDQPEVQLPYKNSVTLTEYRIFPVSCWAAVRVILSKCRLQFLKSVIIRNCGFQDINELEQIGNYLIGIEDLELIQLGISVSDSIGDLFWNAKDLKRFVFINGGNSAIFSPNIHVDISRILEQNKKLTSLTIIDRINFYNDIQVYYPLTYANIQIPNSNLSLWESLEYTSRQTLLCAVQLATQDQFCTCSDFSSIIDMRVRNIFRLPDLTEFPRLKTLTLKFVENITAEECKEMFKYQSTLEIFDSNMLFTQNNQLAQLTYCCPKLKILMVCVTFRFYPNTLNRLTTLNLEKLDIYYIHMINNVHNSTIGDEDCANLIRSMPHLRVFSCNDIHASVNTVVSFFQKASNNPHQMYFIYTPIIISILENNPAVPFNVSITPNWISQGVLSLPTFKSIPLANFDYWMWKKVTPSPNPNVQLEQLNEMAVKVEPVENLNPLAQVLYPNYEWNFQEEDLLLAN